jgi:hypothetical protein
VRAIVFERNGGPEVLEPKGLPDPAPAEGQVVVDVGAIGVNLPRRLRKERRLRVEDAGNHRRRGRGHHRGDGGAGGLVACLRQLRRARGRRSEQACAGSGRYLP